MEMKSETNALRLGVCSYSLSQLVLFKEIAKSVIPQNFVLPLGKDEKRKLEFWAGRYLLASLLKKLNIKAIIDIDSQYGFLRLKGIDSNIIEKYFISLAHSNGFAVCALGQKPVGVDIESLSRQVRIPESFFSSDEIKQARKFIEFSLNKNSSPFLVVWTAKEAFVKATGLGIRKGFYDLRIIYNQGSFINFINLPETPLKINRPVVTFREFDGNIISICSEEEYLGLGFKLHAF